MMFTENEITKISCMADEFCKIYDKFIKENSFGLLLPLPVNLHMLLSHVSITHSLRTECSEVLSPKDRSKLFQRRITTATILGGNKGFLSQQLPMSLQKYLTWTEL